MIINAFMPYITVVTTVGMQWTYRWLDGGDPKKTKKTSMASFMATWGGYDYVVHFKFANLLVVIYVSMMYGLGMPILYPIAAVNFMNQYMCERFILAYFMKQPPVLNDRIIQNFMENLKFAPLFFLGNGYWMFSNR